jgi:hypothetical protein
VGPDGGAGVEGVGAGFGCGFGVEGAAVGGVAGAAGAGGLGVGAGGGGFGGAPGAVGGGGAGAGAGGCCGGGDEGGGAARGGAGASPAPAAPVAVVAEATGARPNPIVNRPPGWPVLGGRCELRVPGGPPSCLLAVTTWPAPVGSSGSAPRNGSIEGRPSIQKRTARPMETATKPMNVRIRRRRMSGDYDD